MLHLWSREYLVTDAEDEAEIDRKTAVDIYQWFRGVCTTKLLQKPTILGGTGGVVQIDESMFCHKPKIQNFDRFNP